MLASSVAEAVPFFIFLLSGTAYIPFAEHVLCYNKPYELIYFLLLLLSLPLPLLSVLGRGYFIRFSSPA